MTKPQLLDTVVERYSRVFRPMFFLFWFSLPLRVKELGEKKKVTVTENCPVSRHLSLLYTFPYFGNFWREGNLLHLAKIINIISVQQIGCSTYICFFLIHALSHLPCKNHLARHIVIHLRKTKVSSTETDTLTLDYIQKSSCLVKEDEASIWVHNERRLFTAVITSLLACFV